MSLLDVLRALVGAMRCAGDADVLMLTEARARKLLNENGVLYGDRVQAEIDVIAVPRPWPGEEIRTAHYAGVRAAYYLGLQIGWRAAQRFR